MSLDVHLMRQKRSDYEWDGWPELCFVHKCLTTCTSLDTGQNNTQIVKTVDRVGHTCALDCELSLAVFPLSSTTNQIRNMAPTAGSHASALALSLSPSITYSCINCIYIFSLGTRLRLKTVHAKKVSQPKKVPSLKNRIRGLERFLSRGVSVWSTHIAIKNRQLMAPVVNKQCMRNYFPGTVWRCEKKQEGGAEAASGRGIVSASCITHQKRETSDS